MWEGLYAPTACGSGIPSRRKVAPTFEHRQSIFLLSNARPRDGRFHLLHPPLRWSPTSGRAERCAKANLPGGQVPPSPRKPALSQSPNEFTGHCEERSDEAIQPDRHGALRAPRYDNRAIGLFRGLLRRDPPVDFLPQHLERHRAAAENKVVEFLDREFRPE